jgi:hypothetical protein
MTRFLQVLLAFTAIGLLAQARPASACGAQQKTTTKAEEKVQPEQKVSGAEPQQGAKSEKAKTAPKGTATASNAGAASQAKNDAGRAHAPQTPSDR